MWNIDDGIGMAALVEIDLARLGLHVALGGSVLHSRQSDKDLDLFIYPRSSRSLPETGDVLDALRDLGFSDFKERFHGYGKPGDDKLVYKSTWGDKRVDFFFLFEAYR